MKKTVAIDIEFIKSLMKVKNLTECEFASAIGVSHSMVNRVVNGHRGGGTKFISGVLDAFPEVSYSQLIKSTHQLTKGNKPIKSA